MAKQAEAPIAVAVARRRAGVRLDNNPWIFIVPAVVYLLVFSLYPLIASLLLSFQEYDFQQRTFSAVGLRNYAEILTSPAFRGAFRNSVVFTIATVVIELVLGMALALFMLRPIPAK